MNMNKEEKAKTMFYLSWCKSSLIAQIYDAWEDKKPDDIDANRTEQKLTKHIKEIDKLVEKLKTEFKQEEKTNA